jgi:hypothetical protein
MGREVSSSSEGRAVQVRVKKKADIVRQVPSSSEGRACADKG